MDLAASEPGSNAGVVAAYDRIAGLYDRVVAPLEAGTRARAIECVDPGAGDVVLELGCGPGRALGPLAERLGPTGRVLGVDAASGMVTRAAGRAGPAAAVALGDARRLPVRTDAVDVVYAEDTLELFAATDIERVLAECRRVLAPSGRLTLVTMERAGADRDPVLGAYEWLFTHVPGAARVGCRPIYARRALASAAFEVVARERHRRWSVWPVEILVATPSA